MAPAREVHRVNDCFWHGTLRASDADREKIFGGNFDRLFPL